MTTNRVSFASLAVVLVAFALFIPHITTAVGLDADAQCIPANPTPCGCGMEMKGNPPQCQPTGNKFGCTCTDTTSGFPTTGTCVATNKCLAKATGGQNGFGLDQVQKILGDLFSKLMQQSQSGAGSGSPTPSAVPTTPPSCQLSASTESSTASSTTAVLTWSTYGDAQSASLSPNVGAVAINGSQRVTVSSAVSYTLTVSGTGGSSSCYTTVIGLAGGSGDANSLSNLLFGDLGGSDTGSSSNTTVNITDILSQITATAATSTQQTAPQPTAPVFNPAFIAAGLRGDIQVINNGATIFAGNRNQTTNTEVSGFYGSNTFSGQPQGIVANLCQNRPWASNFISYVIPPTFFDSLCSLRGYTVGAPQQTVPVVTVVQSTPKPATTSTKPSATATSSQTIEPKVRIRAVPATVPIGSRTSILWASQGVSSCTLTSSDGSFSQKTLSGAASTVPLTGATTFSISCLTPSGTPVTEEVTVRMAI